MAGSIKSKFAPSRGGHAPGDVRDAFRDAVDIYISDLKATGRVSVYMRGSKVDLLTLTGLLWNCTDIAPLRLCQDIGQLGNRFEFDEFYGGGKTYAQCARLIRWHIARETASAA